MDPRTPFDYCAIKPCCELGPTEPWLPHGVRWATSHSPTLLSLCSRQRCAVCPGERR